MFAKPPKLLGRQGAPCNAFLWAYVIHKRSCPSQRQPQNGGQTMVWTTPVLVEICIGLEINGYLPAEF
jgi:coenzyme PQQ precursor peptide PqqA